MKFSSILDSSGRVIGIQEEDENGNIVRREMKGPAGGEIPARERPLPGGSLPNIPIPPSVQREAERKVKEAAEAAAASPGESGVDADGNEIDYGSGEAVNENGLTESAQRSASNRDRRRGATVRDEDQQRYEKRYKTDATAVQVTSEAKRDELIVDAREGNGPLRGLGARAGLGFRNTAYGIIDGLEDITDFGAAVVDVVRRKEVNHEDNAIQLTNRLAAPTSSAGKVYTGILSFLTTSATLSALPGSSAVIKGSKGFSAGKGVAARVAQEVWKDTIVGLVKADPSQSNMFDAARGTKLESPISEFFASDNKEDEAYFVGAIRQAAAELPSNIAFGVAGEALGVAFRKVISEPLIAMTTGAKAARLAALNGDEVAAANILNQTQRNAAIAEESAKVELISALDDGLSSSTTRANDILSKPAGNPGERLEQLELAAEELKVQRQVANEIFPEQPREGFRGPDEPTQVPSSLPERMQKRIQESIQKQVEIEKAIDEAGAADGVTLRSSQERTQAYVAKTFNERITRNQNAAIDKDGLSATLGIEYAKGAQRPLEGPLRPLRSSTGPVGRFVNTARLNGPEDVSQLIQETMDAMPSAFVRDSVSRPEVMADAVDYLASIADLPPAEVDLALLRLAGDADKQGMASVAARLTVQDLAGQVIEKTQKIGEGWKATDAQSLALLEDWAYTLTRLELNLSSYKNVSKGAAQTMSYGSIDLDPKNVSKLAQEGRYIKANKAANESTESEVGMYHEDLKALATSGPQGREDFLKIIKGLKASGDSPEALKDALKVSRFMVLARKGKAAASLINGVRINGLLSGTKTQTSNAFTGALMSVTTPAYQVLGSGLSMPYRISQGGKAGFKQSQKEIQQALATYTGLARYLGDSLRMAAKAFRAGDSILDPSLGKFDAGSRDAVNMLNPQSGSWAIDGALKALSIPSRLLVTGDELIKGVNYRAHVHSTAVLQGMEDGLSGQALAGYAKRMVDASLGIHPETGVKGLALNAASKDYAEFITFQQKLEEGSRAGIREMVEKLNNSKVGFISKLFMPFVNTPLNILAYSSRFTPIAALSKQWRQEFAEGGAKQARIIGELSVATAVWGGSIALLMDGRLIGAGPDYSEKGKVNKFYADGKQPYSIRIGNEWVSYNRFEPFGIVMGIVANIGEIAMNADVRHGKRVDELVMMSVVAFAEVFKDKSFFEGFTQLIDLADGVTDAKTWGSALKRFNERMAPTFIPYSSALREGRRQADDVIREVDGAVDSIRNMIPGLSKDLPAKVNWWDGKERTYSPSPLFNIFPASAIEDNPVLDKVASIGFELNPPGDSFDGVTLTPEQYESYLKTVGTVKINGKTLLQAMDAELNQRGFAGLSDDDKHQMRVNEDARKQNPAYLALKIVMAGYLQAAQDKTVLDNPGIREQLVRKKRLEDERGIIRKGIRDSRKGPRASRYDLNDPLGFQERSPQASEGVADSRLDKLKTIAYG